MAEQCMHFHNDSGFWGDGYICLLKKNNNENAKLDDDWVKRYCWNYGYSDCPYYKNGTCSSGGCYLTSACVEAFDKLDDCLELTVLRKFRDQYIKSTPEGRNDISHYYVAAPQIVEAIKANEETSMEVFSQIYDELVLPCVKMIQEGQYAEAYQLYKEYALMLEHKYLCTVGNE